VLAHPPPWNRSRILSRLLDSGKHGRGSLALPVQEVRAPPGRAQNPSGDGRRFADEFLANVQSARCAYAHMAPRDHCFGAAGLPTSTLVLYSTGRTAAVCDPCARWKRPPQPCPYPHHSA
jgi:hypothetical protein